MFTLSVLMCLVVDQNICQVSGPTTLFPTEQTCEAFYEERKVRIDFTKVTAQHQCIDWNEKT